MKVKITKCSKDTYWYADKVGDVFEVKECEYTEKYKGYKVASEPYYCNLILIDDCKEVGSELKFIEEMRIEIKRASNN